MRDFQGIFAKLHFLSDDQVQMFRSDFRIVADYLVQCRKQKEGLIKEHTPSAETITHVYAVLELMSVMTGDNKFLDAYNESHSGKELKTMCEVLDRIEQRGVDRGMREGIAIGRAQKQSELVSAFVDYVKAQNPDMSDDEAKSVVYRVAGPLALS